MLIKHNERIIVILIQGIYSSTSTQLKSLTDITNEIWRINSMRARESRPPLDYEGCIDVIKKRIGVPNQNKLGKESQGTDKKF